MSTVVVTVEMAGRVKLTVFAISPLEADEALSGVNVIDADWDEERGTLLVDFKGKERGVPWTS